MEEKESSFSGSPENTDSGSPTPISGGPIHIPTTTETHVSSAPPPEISTISGSVYSISGGGSGGGSAGNLMGKKKRGRPRKYDADGNLNPSYAAAAAAAAARAASPAMSTPPPPPGFSLTTSSDFGSTKGRGRGKIHGSGNWNPVASLGELFANTAGGDFTPHVITVQTGEDVAAKIHSLSQKGPRGICILSANGAISNVTIRQPGSSGGLLTYEGRFEILSLTGSFTVSEAGGVTSRTGGLSISLAGPDGRVVGGSVAGWLIAGSPIQVVVGTFVPNGYKVVQKRKQVREPPTSSSYLAPTPISQVMPDVEAGPPAASQMPTQSQSEADNDSIGSGGHNLNNVVSSHQHQHHHQQQHHQHHEWTTTNGSELSSDHRIYPDINVSVPGV